MSVSRRQFLLTSALSASVPLMTGTNAVSGAMAGNSAVDLTLGYKDGAVRMNLNENPLGPPAAAVAAAQSAIPSTNRYVSPALLKTLLAQFHGMDNDWLLVGNGSTEILKLASVAFARNAESNVVSARETWNVTPGYAAKLGAEVRYVKLLKEKSYKFDIDAMLKAVDKNTGIFFVVNPNNPTGALLKYDELKAIADNLPDKVLFIIDEAYAQYNPAEKTGFDLLRQGYKNILVTRTFSKAYGLAALRCGYGAGHPDVLKKIRNFGCDAASLNIGAYSAIQSTIGETVHLEQARALARDIVTFYKRECKNLDLPLVSGPLDLPFVLVELGERAGEIQKQLEKRNIFIRHVASWGLPRHVRVSGGLPAHNEAFIRELKTLV